MAEYAGKTVIFNTEEDLNAAIQQYEEETVTHFVIAGMSSSFSTSELCVNTIRWHLNGNGEGVDIPFDCVPFCWVGRKYLVCHFGKRKTYIKEKHVRTTHKRYKTTKKMNCPAKISIKKIVKFPEFKYTGEGCLKLAKSKIKNRLLSALQENSEAVLKEIQFYVKFAAIEDHKDHDMGEAAAKKEPIDQRVYAKLVELADTGVTSCTVLHSLIYKYVETELFKGQPVPPRSRRRYFPHMKDIQNFMTRWKKKSDKGNSQEQQEPLWVWKQKDIDGEPSDQEEAEELVEEELEQEEGEMGEEETQIEQSNNVQEQAFHVQEQVCAAVQEQVSSLQEQVNSVVQEQAFSTIQEHAGPSSIQEQACSTVPEQVCSTLHEQTSSVIQEQACSTVQDQDGDSVQGGNCNNAKEQVCQSVQEQMYKSTVQKPECNSVEEQLCNSIQEQVHNSVQQQVCNTVHEQVCETVQEQLPDQATEEQAALLTLMNTVIFQTIQNEAVATPVSSDTASSPPKGKRKIQRIGLVRQMKSVMHQILDYSLLVKDLDVLQRFLADLEKMSMEASQHACLDPAAVQRELARNRRKRHGDHLQDMHSTSSPALKVPHLSDVL